MKGLPKKYYILNRVVPLQIPGFIKSYYAGMMTFIPDDINTVDEWYNRFIDSILKASNEKQYFPICRFNDGEFNFMFGEVLPSFRLSFFYWMKAFAGGIYKVIFKDKNLFIAQTLDKKTGKQIYGSGKYTKKEWKQEKSNYYNLIKQVISNNGVLALGLNYGQTKPFNEKYFPSIKRWLKKNNIILTYKNYIPFYFIYAIFSDKNILLRLLSGKKILIITNYDEIKKKNIEFFLFQYNTNQIFWENISSDRSFYDKIDVSDFVGKIDYCFIGAGIGKVNIFSQIDCLCVPSIDLGLILEVWNNQELKWTRNFLVPDYEYNVEKIKYNRKIFFK